MTLGNLVALTQDNVKRMLAYSSIAHTGYMLVGFAAYGAGQIQGLEGLLFYGAAYAFMNLGAFAVIAALQRRLGRDLQPVDVRGPRPARARRSRWLMTLFLLSLTGIPPTAGFFGKFYVILAAVAGATDLVHRPRGDRGAQRRDRRVLLPARRRLHVHARPADRAAGPARTAASCGPASRSRTVLTIALGLFPDAAARVVEQAAAAATPARAGSPVLSVASTPADLSRRQVGPTARGRRRPWRPESGQAPSRARPVLSTAERQARGRATARLATSTPTTTGCARSATALVAHGGTAATATGSPADRRRSRCRRRGTAAAARARATGAGDALAAVPRRRRRHGGRSAPGAAVPSATTATSDRATRRRRPGDAGPARSPSFHPSASERTSPIGVRAGSRPSTYDSPPMRSIVSIVTHPDPAGAAHGAGRRARDRRACCPTRTHTAGTVVAPTDADGRRDPRAGGRPGHAVPEPPRPSAVPASSPRPTPGVSTGDRARRPTPRVRPGREVATRVVVPALNIDMPGDQGQRRLPVLQRRDVPAHGKQRGEGHVRPARARVARRTSTPTRGTGCSARSTRTRSATTRRARCSGMVVEVYTSDYSVHLYEVRDRPAPRHEPRRRHLNAEQGGALAPDLRGPDRAPPGKTQVIARSRSRSRTRPGASPTPRRARSPAADGRAGRSDPVDPAQHERRDRGARRRSSRVMSQNPVPSPPWTAVAASLIPKIPGDRADAGEDHGHAGQPLHDRRRGCC